MPIAHRKLIDFRGRVKAQPGFGVLVIVMTEVDKISHLEVLVSLWSVS